MTTQPIYLDHNATAPVLPEVADAMQSCLEEVGGNPASQHQAGRNARARLEECREFVGDLLGARVGTRDADQVIFTSGGTEANNLAIFGLARRTPGRVIRSVIEHPSVVGACDELARHGWQVNVCGVSGDGTLRVEQFQELLAEGRCDLATVMLANNETGALQPVAEVSALCRWRGVLLHTDAVQAVGKVPVDFAALGVDALSFTGHKLHGPVGIGVLVLRHGVVLEPQLFGGFQQSGLRPGTENLALVVGLRTALELWRRDVSRQSRLASLRDRFEQQILSELPDTVVNAHQAERVPHVSNLAFPGLDRQELFVALDFAGVFCSTGSACVSGSNEPSPTLIAMGLPKGVVDASLRFSMGAGTTEGDVQEAASRIIRVCKQLRARKDPPFSGFAPRENSPNSVE